MTDESMSVDNERPWTILICSLLAVNADETAIANTRNCSWHYDPIGRRLAANNTLNEEVKSDC